MIRRLYIDTSAYLAVLLAEPGHEALVSEFNGAELVSSTLLLLEAERNLVRHAREGRMTADSLRLALERLARDVAAFELHDLTIDLCLSRELPLVSTPRTLDLVHLRTALWFDRRAKLTRFVTLDAAQCDAARDLGLPL